MKQTHKIILASAGTGKTYSLVENYLEAVLGKNAQPIKPQEILALTFTQKAANEMKMRIASRLSEAIYEKNTNLSQNDIRKVIRSFASSSINTFHSFAASFLRQHSHKAFLHNDFSILAPYKEKLMAQNILSSLLFGEIQLENAAIKNLIARFKIESGYMSMGLLDGIWNFYTSFLETNHDFTDIDGKNKYVLCLESCTKIVEHVQKIHKLPKTSKLQAQMPLITEHTTLLEKSLNPFNEVAVKEHFLGLKSCLKGNFGGEAKRELCDLAEELGNKLIDYVMSFPESNVVKLLKSFHEKFTLYKKENHVVSYFDLLKYSVNILANNEDIRTETSKQYKHILVDEYQDTSGIQQDLVLLLSGKEFSGALRNISSQVELDTAKSLFVVGDKKQSIYGFRGADLSLLFALEEKMRHNPSIFYMKHLKINRRSVSSVIDFANFICKDTLASQKFSIEDELESIQAGKGSVAIWSSESEEADFAEITALGIQDFLNIHGQENQNIAVLVRKTKSAEAVKKALSKYGISSKVISGEGFYQSQEIVELISALRLVIQPSCSLSFLTVLRSPLILWKDNDILALNVFLSDIKETFSVHSCEKNITEVPVHSDAIDRLTRFFEILKQARNQLTKKTLGEVLDLFLLQTDFLSYYSLETRGGQISANVEKLRSLLSLSYENPLTFIHELYTQIDGNKKEPLAPLTSNEFQVQIMTIHQSKGLEFDTVILADLESTLVPSKDILSFGKDASVCLKPDKKLKKSYCFDRSDKKSFCKWDENINTKKHLDKEEQKRLLYVGITRAKQNLFMALSCKSLLHKSKRDSLAALLMGCKQKYEEEFSSLCETKLFKKEPLLTNLPYSEVKKAYSPEKKLFSAKICVRRLFCSHLKVPNKDFQPFFYEVNKRPSSVNGTQAHAILSLSLENMFSFKELSLQAITSIVQASGLSLGEKVSSSTLRACVESAKILHEDLKKAKAMYSEMHLISRPTPQVLVEGFCDLAIDNLNTIDVIDFKSGFHQLQEPQTFLQLFAYAFALEQKFAKKVRYKVHYIGSNNQPAWRNYDKECKKIFLDSVGLGYDTE